MWSWKSGAFLLVGLLLFGEASAAAPDARIQVQTPAVFQQDLEMPDAIRLECGVDRMVGDHALQKIGERMAAKAWPADEPEPFGSALRLTVVLVEGWGGGGWSGAKAIRVRVDVLKDGMTTVTKEFFRDSRGGVFGNMMGTCSIMERIAQVLGADIADWLPEVTTVTALPPRQVATPPGATRKHRLPVPAATAFAGVDEAAAVPLGDKGRERYLHYLTLPNPKAFVVSESKGWRFMANDADAMTKALELCAATGKRCWLYAVDERIVWSDEVGKRVALPQLDPH